MHQKAVYTYPFPLVMVAESDKTHELELSKTSAVRKEATVLVLQIS